MLKLYIFSFLAGVLASNGAPHFIKGITGQKHQTPFGKPSSAVVNVCWGWLNLIVAALFLHLGHVRTHEYRAFVLFAIGALAMGVFSAMIWTKHPEHNK